MTSRNQPHCPLSHHITTKRMTSYQIASPPSTSHHHHRHTTETQLATTKTPQPKHHQTEPPKASAAHKTSVWALRSLVALRTFYMQILSLSYRCFPPEASAPGSQKNCWQIRISLWRSTAPQEVGLTCGGKKAPIGLAVFLF